MLLLVDRDLDPRVTELVWDLAAARGAEVRAYVGPTPGINTLPDEVRPIAKWATFVVSTWYSSIGHPVFQALRRDKGQRWVKITYFRDFDDLSSEMAAFPLDVLELLIRKTAAMIPRGVPLTLAITNARGTPLRRPGAPPRGVAALGATRARRRAARLLNYHSARS